MTIIWAGGEDLDFECIGGAPVETAYYRSSYARCALGVPVQRTATTGMVTYWNTGNIFALANFWLSARCADTSYCSPSNEDGNSFLVRWYDAAGLPRLQVSGIPWGDGNRGNSSLNGFRLQTLNAAGTVTTIATTTNGFVDNYIAKLDFHINYLSSFTMYVDGLAHLTFTGTLATDANTGLGGFSLGQSAQYGSDLNIGSGAGGTAYWSELIIATTDTRSMSLQTLPPTGAGATSAWVGDANGDTVNLVSFNDGAGITSASAGEIELFTQGGTYTAPYIAGIVVSARAMTGSSAPQNMSLLLNQGGTTYASPALALGGYFAAYQYVWQSDPSTGAPFAVISSMQTGIESLT